MNYEQVGNVAGDLALRLGLPLAAATGLASAVDAYSDDGFCTGIKATVAILSIGSAGLLTGIEGWANCPFPLGLIANQERRKNELERSQSYALGNEASKAAEMKFLDENLNSEQRAYRFPHALSYALEGIIFTGLTYCTGSIIGNLVGKLFLE
ncbi:MAG TPA: hypothetical protein VJJ82_00690 [Candidatus Nanoarchaeia archaeon]|nr:hypothetical protein [Candidatus Nanoarchaeia archaeon]